MLTIYTVGHSNRSIDAFLSILLKYTIEVLVDLRSYPYSKMYPHFSTDQLRESVNNNNINYYWVGQQLGGLRQGLQESENTALKNAHIRAFADYMQSESFQKAIVKVQEIAFQQPTVLMCAEKDYSQCHRSLISDYLTLQNIKVKHILDHDTCQDHTLRPEARCESTKLVYDRMQNMTLNF